MPLLLIHRAVKLKDLFNFLEEQLKLEQIPVSVSEVKNNLLARIQAKGEPVAFDSVADTPKAVAKFIFDLSTVVGLDRLSFGFAARNWSRLRWSFRLCSPFLATVKVDRGAVP